MIPQMTPLARKSLVPLAWDSEHLGLPVARIVDANVDDSELEETLGEARRNDVGLVYWLARGDRRISASLRHEFSGALVDRRVTYGTEPSVTKSESPAAGGIIGDYPKGPPTRDLLELAVAAGAHSRFSVDPRFPRDKFVQLFESWMRKSTLGEMADHVLVAKAGGPFSECLGVVTVSLAANEARIGLIAVKAQARGKGVGFALVEAAHQKAIAKAISRMVVSTQLANIPACRLYERCGYSLSKLQNHYHFWLH